MDVMKRFAAEMLIYLLIFFNGVTKGNFTLNYLSFLLLFDPVLVAKHVTNVMGWMDVTTYHIKISRPFILLYFSCF